MDTIPQNAPQKQCSKCLRFFPATLDHFQSHKRHKDGFASQCKECISKQRKEQYQNPIERAKISTRNKRYRDANLDALHAKAKQKREKNGGENYKQARQKYLQANPEKRQKWNRTKYERHKQVLKERDKRWRQTEAGKAYSRAYVHKRRAIHHMADGHYTASDLKKQYANQKGFCYYCHKKLDKKYEVDHVIPLSRGGTNDPSNIVIACRPCNRKKQDKLPHEWIDGGRLL